MAATGLTEPVPTRRGSGERIRRPGTAVVLGRDGGLAYSGPEHWCRFEVRIRPGSGRIINVDCCRGVLPVQLLARETRSVHVRARDVAGALVLTAVLVGGVVFLVLGSVPVR